MSDYFYKEFKCKTLVLTNKSGYEYLENHPKRTESIIFGKPGNFIEESKLLLKSKYFYQIQGGGISTWPILSSMPYTMLSNRGFLVPYKKNTILAVNNQNQLHLSSRSYSVEEYWKIAKHLGRTILSVQ